MGGSERKADDAVEEGLALFQQGKLELAMKRWREAQELAPGHPRAQEYIDYVDANREALEQRFSLAETQFFNGRKARPTSPLSDVPSKLRLPAIEEDDDEEDEPTVSMPVKVLTQRLARSRDGIEGKDGDYLEVMEGGGQEGVDDFEPMEKTPVGEIIPDPVRLVATEGEEEEVDDGIYEWDEDTPSVREVGTAPLLGDDDRIGMVTGTELSLEADEVVQELDDADIVEEIVQEPPLEPIEVKYGSLAEFDAAYDEEYLDEDEGGEALEAAELNLEAEPVPPFKETLRMEVEPDRGPALDLEPEPEPEEQGGMLELMPPDSGEERELEVDLNQSAVPGPSQLVDLTPHPDRRSMTGEDRGEDMVQAAAARERERDAPTDEDLMAQDDVSAGEFSLDGPTPELEMEVQVSVSGQAAPPPPESAPGFKSIDINMEDSIDMSPDDVEFGGEFGGYSIDDVGTADDDLPASVEDDGGFGLADHEEFDVSGDDAFDVSGDDAFDVSDDESFDVSGNEEFDVSGDEEFDVSDDESFDVSGNEEFDVSGDDAFDVSGDESFDVSGGSSSDRHASVSQDGFSWEEGSVDWSEDSGEQQGLEVMVFEHDEPTPALNPDDPLMAMPTQQESLDPTQPDEQSFDGVLGDPAEDPLAWSSTEETPDAPMMEPEARSLPQAAAKPVEASDPSLERARSLLKSGELEESLLICEKVCDMFPDDDEASRFRERIQQSLVKRYWADIGDLSHVPSVKVPHHEILWQDMDHRKGFLLSRIDGMLSYGDIIDISGMEEFEVCHILVMLKREGVIS